jgi:uncharacterized protein
VIPTKSFTFACRIQINALKGHSVSTQKIFNDPVYGFITVSDTVIQKLIDHPDFQRLGRISQVGLSSLVYPGSQHTRFHHALGAMHLMQQAILVLRNKGIEISDKEERGALIAILLHDIGHGPFSHTLEGNLVHKVHHEDLSIALMQRLADKLHPSLEEALQIFRGNYTRPFFHQLVSGQLDVDRLDYLMRDSFYTGVAEGVIGSERIIKMMHVLEESLVVEEKGIYSIEKFLIARRLMYWQVYLHKTVLGAESLLTLLLNRAKWLFRQGEKLFATPSLSYFLENEIYSIDDEMLSHFVLLDDHDIMASVKVWSLHTDRILSDLCNRMLHRRLLKVRLSSVPLPAGFENELTSRIAKKLNVSTEESSYYLRSGTVSNQAYDTSKGDIKFIMKNGKVLDFFEASHNLHPENMTEEVIKYFVCYPKEIHAELEAENYFN